MFKLFKVFLNRIKGRGIKKNKMRRVKLLHNAGYSNRDIARVTSMSISEVEEMIKQK